MVRPRVLFWFFVVVALAAVTGVFQGGPPHVSAHALLVRADPPVNAQLRDPPTQLVLYFSEPLERKFSGVRVTDQNNARVDDTVSFDDTDNALMRVSLKPVTPGYLTINWETVSAADGHRVSGSYPLTILNADGSIPPGKPSVAGATTSGGNAKVDRFATRWVILLSMSLMTGAFAFLALVTPALDGEAGGRARASLQPIAITLAGVGLLIMMPAAGLELVEQARSVGSNVGDILHSSYGAHWLEREAALLAPLLAALVYAIRPNAGKGFLRAVAFVALIGAGVYWAASTLSTHGAAGGGSFWAEASDFVHMTAAAVWLGMLALVIVLVLWARKGLERNERFPILATGLQRFSAVAVVSVALLTFTGTLNAVIEIGGIGDMLDSGYGRTLLLKLFLIAPLLILGAANAYVLRPRLVQAVQGRGRARQATLPELEDRLARGVRWELGIGVLVLAMAALLGQQTPAQGRLAAPTHGSGKFTESATAEGIGATLVIDPNQPGINSFEVYLTGAVDVVESVRLDFTSPKGEDSRLQMDPSNPPTFYVGKGPYLADGGKWKVGVDVRRSKGSDLLMAFTTNVQAPGVQATASRSGGALGSPISVTPLSAVLLAGSLFLAFGLVFGSYWPRDEIGGVGAVVAGRVSRRMSRVRIRPAWSLAGLLIAGCGLGLLLGAHVHNKVTPQEAKVGNPVESTQESIDRGHMLFLQNCTQCHGESGRGDGPLAKSLPIPPANLYLHIPYHPDQFFFGIMTNGLSGIMPSFSASIGETDRWNILNYLRANFSQDPQDK